MTRCDICGVNALDAHTPTLCADCCPVNGDPVAMSISALAALAALTVRDVAELADRLSVPVGDIVRCALAADRVGR